MNWRVADRPAPTIEVNEVDLSAAIQRAVIKCFETTDAEATARFEAKNVAWPVLEELFPR